MTDTEFLYLTTTGRKTGQPREIEIWFVAAEGKYYVIAENREDAQWVKNILHNPQVRVRVGDRAFNATARVLDPQHDRAAYEHAQRLEEAKYGWSDGLPVEIAPDN